jgi:hypothetical protein
MTWINGQRPHSGRQFLREIKLAQIESIGQLGHPKGPVFLLTFKGSILQADRLVVKAERGTDRGARFTTTAEIMRIVDPHAIAELISASELLALKQAALWMGTDNLRFWLSAAETFFVKMKVRNHLGDLQKPLPQGFDAAQIEFLHKVLPQLVGNQSLWESLGEIVAVDLFLGNADRIAPGEVSGAARLQNAGNVFLKFDAAAKLKKAIALDNFDTNEDASRIRGPEIPIQWLTDFAPILKNDGPALSFSRTVIEQVILHGKTVGVAVDIGEKEVGFFFEGFKRGLAKLKVYVLRSFRVPQALIGGARENPYLPSRGPNPPRAQLPRGIIGRAKSLGWI